MNGDSNDYSPYDNKGTNIGNISFINGKIGKSGARFSDGRIETQIKSSDIEDFTFSLWLYNELDSWGSFSTLGTRSGDTGWMLYRNSGDTDGILRWYLHYNNTSGGISPYRAWMYATGLESKKWHHIVVTHSHDGICKIYVDSNLQSYGDKPSDFSSWRSSDSSLLSIGSERVGSSSWNANYLIYDDIRLYNRVLNEEEIKSLFTYNECSNIENTTYTNEGVSIEESITNLWSGNLLIYNNYGVPATLEKLDETYLGQPIYRLGMTVNDAKSSYLSNFQTSLYSHGVYGSSNNRLFKANTKYSASIYWRNVNKNDIVFGGTASNIGGWSSNPTISLSNGWNRYYQTRSGSVTEDKSDNVYFSFYCPSLKLNETVYIDLCCPQIEEGETYPKTYVSNTRNNGNVKIPINTGKDFTIFYKYIPDANWAVVNGSNSFNRYKWYLYDKLTGKKIWYSDYRGGTTSTTHSSPWIGFDQFVTSSYSGTWHWHYTSHYMTGHKEYWFALTKNGATWKKHFIDDNGYHTQSTVHTDQALIDFEPSEFELYHEFNWTCKDLQVFNRELSESELKQLATKTFSADKDGNINNTLIEERDEGWNLVYHGLATYSQEADPQAFVNIGDNIEFDEIKITCPFWNYEVRNTLTSLAKLEQPFSYYARWLDQQPDSPAPKIKFHNASTGVQDVGLSSPDSMLFGYGNSWRRITPVHFVDGITGMYHGSVPSYIKYEEWFTATGDARYQSSMDRDTDRESGRYQLTPREFQTIQVWVRKKPQSEGSRKIQNKDGKLIVNSILEGVTNLSQ